MGQHKASLDQDEIGGLRPGLQKRMIAQNIDNEIHHGQYDGMEDEREDDVNSQNSNTEGS